jgi:hypothetical protein
MERTFDVPQAAAGPLVTPTNPILSFVFSAKAVAEVAASIAAPITPNIARRDMFEMVLILNLPH